MYQAPIFWGH